MDLTIRSDQELENMKKRVETFRAEINAFDFNPVKHPGVEPRLVRHQFDALCAVYADICTEVCRYFSLRVQGTYDALPSLPQAAVEAGIKKMMKA